MNQSYTLTLTQKQLQTLSEALEVYSRLGLGQWRSAFECLPLNEKSGAFDWSEWHCFLDQIGREIQRFTKRGVDGHRSSLGIYGDDTPERSQVAWDIHQVIRHYLSWKRAVEHNLVSDMDAPRNWREMLGVNYDEPMPVSGEPLAKIGESDECGN